MARYTNDITTGKSAAQIGKVTADFMAKEGFEPWKDEKNTWKKGIGLLISPQFIKVATSGNKVHIEAWLKFAWLPGVYSGEMGLSGFFGWAVKKALRSKVTRLEKSLD